jgi:hypothetical protein
VIAGLTFDAATHTYRMNGEVVPGVTSILKPLSDFSMVPVDVLKAASAFGTAVHLACELWDKGVLDEEALDPALVPYLEGWKRFCTDHAVEWTLIEAKVYHPTMRYAGTLDRYGKVMGKAAVVDIKTSAELYPSVGPQLAAYKNAIPDAPPVTARMAVQLKADGNYVAKTYTNRTDWPMFASLVTVRNWCAEHNVTPHF